MRFLAATVLMAALAVAPVSSAQAVRWYAGPTVAWFDAREEARLGLNVGVSFQRFDEHTTLRADVRYVQRGDGCCPLHSLQAPILFTTMLTETGYVFAGPAIGYSYDDVHILDLSAVGGVGFELSRTETVVVGVEVAYSLSLPTYYVSRVFETHDPLKALSLSLTLRTRTGHAPSPEGPGSPPLVARGTPGLPDHVARERGDDLGR